MLSFLKFACPLWVIVWGNTYTSKLNKLRTKQNKVIRNIFFAHSTKNAKLYFTLLGILKFDNIFKLRIAEFTYKLIKMKEKLFQKHSHLSFHRLLINIPTLLDMLLK